MSGELEVNSSYQGVAASWLGLETNIYTNKKPSKNEKKSNIQSTRTELAQITRMPGQQSQVPEGKKEGIKTNSIIKYKLEKKIIGSRERKHDFVQKRKNEDASDAEDSKSNQVKAKKLKSMTPSSTSIIPSVQELNTRLLDSTLSKKARKRIRQKIAMLSQCN